MMADKMGSLRRTVYCGKLTKEKIGNEEVVCGWVQRQRDKGHLIFIDLRDRTGVVQLVFNDQSDRDIFEKAAGVRAEFVLMAKGIVMQREGANPELATGEVELLVTTLQVLSKAQTPPFEITDRSNVKEELRLKYRYLDLRRRQLQENMIRRHEIAQVTRAYFYKNDFLEIETPMMIKSTPEGARDYLVPSRLHEGKFYALPQSPQIYKQLLMLSGYDRYIQLARCFRDEDLRADRQPEFTQIDIEMSFVDQQDIINMMEGFMEELFAKVLGVSVKLPIQTLTFEAAMARYGTDKPDTRFGMEIVDLTAAVQGCRFPVFAQAIEEGGSVQAIVAKNAAQILTRKSIDKLTEQARGIGAKGLAFFRWADETPTCSFAKFLEEEESAALLQHLQCQKGDVVLIMADKTNRVLPVLGQLRTTLGKQLGLIPEGRYDFVWITEFPFFEWDEANQAWAAMHHPFTMPMEECLEYLDSDPGKVRAKAYDLVLNGVELLSGSIRITDFTLQQKMFTALGLTEEEIQAKFGFLVDAYRYGAPPHGGVGMGLDRLVMLMCGAENLRDVIAFPKVQNASELMSQCPSNVDTHSLDELGITITRFEKLD